MKTRAYRTWTLLVLWLGAVALTTSCGLGTEVGNGFKPKKDSDDEGAKSAKMPAESNDTTSDSDVGGSDSANEESQDGSAPTVDAVKINDSIPKALLFATCGSPLADEVELPFDLIMSDGEALVWHVAAGDGAMVTLRGETAGDAWDLDRTVPGAMVVKDENGEEVTDVYKCLSDVERKVTKQDDDTFVEASHVGIDHDGLSYTVSWATTYASETGPRRLTTISISAPDSEATELEARY